MNTCPVMNSLRRYLAEEAAAEREYERHEAICTEVREEVEECLMHSNNAADLMSEISAFFDSEKLDAALVAAFRGAPDAHDLLAVAIEDAMCDYIAACATERMRRQ